MQSADIAILAAMRVGAQYTAQQLADTCEIDIGRVRRVLRRCTRVGVVARHRPPSQRCYVYTTNQLSLDL